jgi:hypothetical protein
LETFAAASGRCVCGPRCHIWSRCEARIRLKRGHTYFLLRNWLTFAFGRT